MAFPFNTSPVDISSIPQSVVDSTNVIHSLNYILSHLINEKQQTTQSLRTVFELLVPSSDLLKIALIGVLLYFVLLYSFSFILKRFFGEKKQPNHQIKYLLFAFVLFLFFVEQFYHGTINTESVTVDLSDILYSNERILNSDFEPCFLEERIEMSIFKYAPKSSLAYKIYLKRNRNDPCFLLKKNAGLGHLAQMKNLKRLFFLIADLAIDFMPKLFQSIGKQNTYSNLSPICESVRTLIIRKNLRKDIKDYLNFVINLYTSAGIFQKALTGFGEFSGFIFPKTGSGDAFVNYDNLQSYLEAHSLVSLVTFHSLDYFFRIYFSILTLLLALSLRKYVQKCLVRLIKKLCRIRVTRRPLF